MYFLQSLQGHASGFRDLINNVKVATSNFLRRFCSNILLKILILFLNCYCYYKFWSVGVI